METKRTEVIERSSLLFMKFGIKSVTMDDVARELGISKKTLYKYFSDKSELVNAILNSKLDYDKAVCGVSRETSENAIDELFNLSKLGMEHIGNINPVVFYDLKKYHPEGWQLMQEHKWHFMLDTIRLNIARGIKEGMYRDNLDAEVIARLYVASTDLILGGDVFPFPEFKIDKVFLETVRFHVRGMASDKGIAYLKERVKQETNE